MTFLLACSQKKDNTPAPGPGPDMTPPAMQPEPEMAPEPAMTPEPAMAPDPKTATPPVAPGALLEIPPDATVVETPLWHQTFTLEGKKYIALNSSRYKESKDLKGYTAPIELAAIFDEAGTIVRVMVVTHKETPEFMERIVKEWLPKLADLKKDKPIVGEGGIDALSEATVSTTAMTKTIDEMRKLAFTQILKIELPATPATPAAEDMAAPAADDMAAAPADMK
ncbi:MAG: hypothetical protein CVU65_10720 [Deltaproteobacteria bacterium HGW-Deltaproteobacteria-22]|nr:MAG: hypothetical protein CVU65_10720 [Deltaproteobacteria bacterium HGW-Deltaproteobacteria-22]